MTAGDSMPSRPITRRRAIALIGAVAGLPLLAGRNSSLAPLDWRRQAPLHCSVYIDVG